MSCPITLEGIYTIANKVSGCGNNDIEGFDGPISSPDGNKTSVTVPVKGAFMLFLALFIYLFCSELLKAGFPKIAALTFFASITLCYGIYVTEKWPKYIKFSSFELGGD